MDQENYKEAFDAIDYVLRQQPKHADALILRGKIQFKMRKLVEATEIELGPSQDDTVIVPGETVKINLRDPTLSVSGVGADIEVEIWAASGDSERVMLNQLGDSKEKFRAEIPTVLGAPVKGDKILQILGKDEIRFGYSKRFRAKMDDLPADPELAIEVGKLRVEVERLKVDLKAALEESDELRTKPWYKSSSILFAGVTIPTIFSALFLLSGGDDRLEDRWNNVEANIEFLRDKFWPDEKGQHSEPMRLEPPDEFEV